MYKTDMALDTLVLHGLYGVTCSSSGTPPTTGAQEIDLDQKIPVVCDCFLSH